MRWYRRPWVIVLAIIFYPLGVVLMWLYAPWHRNIKWGITALAAVATVAAMFSGGSTTEAPSTPMAGVLASPTASAAPTLTPTPTPTPMPTPTPTPLPGVGDVVYHENWIYAVFDVRRDKSITWTSFGNVEMAKGKFVGVFLIIENISDRTMGLNSWDFWLMDSSGRKYTPDFGATYAYRKRYDLHEYDGRYPPGAPVETVIGFDVAPDAEGFQIHFKQGNLVVDLASATP